MSEVKPQEVTPKAKKSRERYNISPEVFVTVWQQAETAQEAADRMSEIAGKRVPKEIVLARASVYRKAGVNLKKMERKNPRKLDVGNLNGSIDESAA